MHDFILHGNVVYSKNKDELILIENGYVVCKNGICEGAYDVLPEEYKDFEIAELGDKVIIPGFTDIVHDFHNPYCLCMRHFRTLQFSFLDCFHARFYLIFIS